jgi:hypothetical protein
MALVKTTTWDLRVVSAQNAASVISYVPRWTSIEFSDQLSDIGSARVVHDLNDPFFDAFEAENGQSLLTGPYALQILRNSTVVYTFFIEDVQVDRAGQTQPLIISGRGIAAALEWAVVLPENFTGNTRIGASTVTRPRFFDRLFPGYNNVTRCATTANLSATYSNGFSTDIPGVGAQLTSTSNTSLNTSGIDGITDLVIGDTVLVKNQTTAAHNGIYWVVDFGSASRPWIIQRVATADGSPVSDLEIGRRVWVQEGTTNGYKGFTLTPASTITTPTQVGSVGLSYSEITSVDGSYTGIGAFYILFHEADSGYEHYTQQTQNWGQQNQSAGRGADLAVSWPLSLDATLTSSLGKTDSKGKVVQDGGTFSIPVGKTLIEVIKQAADQTQSHWHVDGNGVISIVVKPFSRNGVVNSVPFGTDRTTGSGAKLLSLPMLEQVETKTSASALRTVAYGSDGRQLDRLISGSSDTYGIRESYFENTSDDAPAVANITASAIREVEGGKVQVTASFAEREGFVVYEDFNIGDKVLVESEVGVYVERIVSAISCSISSNNEQKIELTFGEIFPDIAENLSIAAGFGSLNANTLATFSGKPSNVYLSPPTSTSIISDVVGLSNRAVISWDSADAGRVSQYEIASYRVEETLSGLEYVEKVNFANDIRREGNIAVVTLPSAHGYAAGNLVNIECNADHMFTAFAVPILAVTSSVAFAYNNLGPDITITSASVASITKVIEYASTIVDGSKNSAAIENLSSPGRTYYATITPYNEFGLAGETSIPESFVASFAAYELLDATIQSSGYVENTSGWNIAADGTAEFNSLTATADINGGSITIGGNDSTSFHVRSDGAMWLGSASIANAPFFVNPTGSMYAISGNIAGFDLYSEYMTTGASFVGNMHFGNLNAVGIGNGEENYQLAGLYVLGPDFVGAKGNKALLTFDSLKMSNASNEITSVHPDGIKYYGNTSGDKFRMRFDSDTGRLYVDIEHSNGAVVEYCIASCGEVTTTTTTTPAPGTTTTTTTTSTTPAPNRYCTTGDLGFYTCDSVGQCRSGASGALCSSDLTTTTTAAPTTTTTTAAPTTTTTTTAGTTAGTTAAPIDCSSGYSCVDSGVCSPLPPGASANCRKYTCTKAGCNSYSYCSGPSCP